MSADGRLVWVVNPGGDNVAVISTRSNRVIRRIDVGNEPESVAVDPNNRYAFVANAADGTVTVIRIRNANPNRFRAAVDRRAGRRGTLVTGAEPWNIVASPNGRRVYVANSGQDTITVIDARSRRVRRRTVGPRVLGHINLQRSRCNDRDIERHFQPRGLAVTRDSRKLYVTSFLSFTRPGGRQADDNGKQGIVCRVNINTRSNNIRNNRPALPIEIEPRVTGFQVDANGDTVLEDTTAFPNQMQSIVIRGGQAFLPNIAASPDGPLRFNSSTQAFVNVVDGVNGVRQTDGSTDKFLNLHLGARTPEAGKKRLFFANVWAIGFTNQRGNGSAYTVSAGSDLLVKVNVTGNGALSFTGGPATTRYIDLNDPDNPATSGDDAGKQPQGIAISRNGNTAYVANFVSRNVSVVNLNSDEVERTIRIAPLPQPGSQEETVAVGAEMFFSSRGNFNPPAGDERLSSEGWQSCASCHFEGLTDGVIWEFGSGPRKSVPLNATFNPNNRDEQRALNYSAIFDEVEDFDLNVRNVSGPGPIPATEPPIACNTASAAAPSPTRAFRATHGLIISDNGDITQPPCAIPSLIPISNANRQQVTVTLPGSNTAVPAMTALREWVKFAVRTPDGAFTSRRVGNRLSARQVRQGRALFAQAGCANCHGTNLFTNSRRLPPPPPATEVFTERPPPPAEPPPGNPVAVQFVNRLLSNIGSFNLGVPGGGNEIGSNVGADETTNVAGLATGPQGGLGRDYNGDGAGNGFNIPSLLGIDNVQPYYHNGACETLACVVGNAKHRTANNTQPDRLTTTRDRARVVAFLRSID